MIITRITLGAVLAMGLMAPAQAEIAIQTITTPAGHTAWLVEDHSIPFTALEMRIRGGTSLDDPAKRGAVNLMTALIEEGTGELDSQGFAAARDALAASFAFSVDEDTFAVSAQFLTENADQAVDLLASALSKPRFDQDAIDRVRGQILAGLRANETDPEHIAGKDLRAMAFGDHPYGSLGDGTIDSVTALTRDDVVAAHQAAVVKDRVFIGASGDITPEQLGVMVDKILAELPKATAPLPPKAEYGLTGGVTLHDFPGPQSVVLFAQPGMRLDDPDYFAANILNEVLGGGRFSARLMTEVREKRGLTYGIGTSMVQYDQAEWLVGQASVANEKVAEAIQVIRDEWARIAAEGITEEELATTKTYMTGAYPLRFDGNGQIASILVNMQLIGLPIDYPQTRNDMVNAVTIEDVKRVAARLFQPDALRFIVAGQPVGVTAE